MKGKHPRPNPIGFGRCSFIGSHDEGQVGSFRLALRTDDIPNRSDYVAHPFLIHSGDWTLAGA